MPANKLNAKVKSYNSNGDISLIDYDGLKYSYRCAAIPMGPLTVEVYNQNKDFINCLSQDVRKKMKVRPFPLGGWETKDRYIDDFGIEIARVNQILLSTIDIDNTIPFSSAGLAFGAIMVLGLLMLLALKINVALGSGEQSPAGGGTGPPGIIG